MTQQLHDDGLTANQRRDRELLLEFNRRQAAINQMRLDCRGNSLRLAEADQRAMTQRAPHLFRIDQHGRPFVRETWK